MWEDRASMLCLCCVLNVTNAIIEAHAITLSNPDSSPKAPPPNAISINFDYIANTPFHFSLGQCCGWRPSPTLNLSLDYHLEGA